MLNKYPNNSDGHSIKSDVMSGSLIIGEESSVHTIKDENDIHDNVMLEMKYINDYDGDLFSDIEQNKIEDITIKTDKNVDRSNNSCLYEILCGCVGGADRENIKPRFLFTCIISSALIFVFIQETISTKLSSDSLWTNLSSNSIIGPSPKVIFNMGALDANLIRGGQIERLFWSFWLHTGILHLSVNVLSQIALGIILESTWVIWRYLILYFVGGLVGNLFSSVFDPCSLSAGSSACFFALISGVIVLLIENWRKTPWQLFYIISIGLAALLGLSLSFISNTDNWAHIGGFIAGLLWSFSTIEVFPGYKKMDIKDREKSKNNSNKKSFKAFYHRIFPVNCQCTAGIQTVRVISFLVLTVIITLGLLLLLYSPIYTKFNIAVGHLSFSGIKRCSCCNTPEGQFWCSSADKWAKVCLE